MRIQEKQEKQRKLDGFVEAASSKTTKKNIFIQETHIETEAEAEELELQWWRVWGLTPDNTRKISFWSHGSGRAAGVAILISPYMVQETYILQSAKKIILQSATMRVINIYAPQAGPQQDQCYKDLKNVTQTFDGDIVTGGDLNCTVATEWDRTTKGRRGKDSQAGKWLQQVCEHWGVVDTLHQTQEQEDIDWEDYRDRYHTYGNIENSSRLDRFYMSPRLVQQVTHQTAAHSSVPSDHKTMVVWLGTMPKIIQKKKLYPVGGRDQKAIKHQVKDHLGEVLACQHTVATYGITIDRIVRTLKTITKTEQLRRRRSQRRRQRRRARFEGVQPAIIKALE